MTDIAALRELLASASPGPWEHVRVRPMQHEVFTADDGVCVEGGAAISTWHAADARLIAAAVNALPAALDETEQLRGEVERLRDGLVASQGAESKARNERDDARRERDVFSYDRLAPERDSARAEASRLKALVVEACDLAEEGWEYAADYFNQKWEPRPRLAAIRAEAERSGT